MLFECIVKKGKDNHFDIIIPYLGIKTFFSKEKKLKYALKELVEIYMKAVLKKTVSAKTIRLDGRFYVKLI